MTDTIATAHLKLNNEEDIARCISLISSEDIRVCVGPTLMSYANRVVIPAEITVLLLNMTQALFTRDLLRAGTREHMAHAVYFAGALCGSPENNELRDQAVRAYDAVTGNLARLFATRMTLRQSDEMNTLLLQSERNERLEALFYAPLLERAGDTVSLLEAALLVFNSLEEMILSLSLETVESLDDEFSVRQHRQLYGYVSNRGITHCLVADNETANEINLLLQIIANT